MSAPVDAYAQFVRQGPGAALARRLGAPRPAALRRFRPGAPLLTGPAVVIGAAAAPHADDVARWLAAAGADVAAAPEATEERFGAVVLDASAVRTTAELASLREPLAPAFRRLAVGGRVVVLGAVVAETATVEAAAVQQALEGLVRTLGKEARSGGTVNLLRVGEAAGQALRGPLEFLVSARAAFVSGQVLEVGAARAAQTPGARTAVVTGAAQGIGAAIAEVLARSGTHVVCVDLAAQGEQLARIANRVGGSALHLDITAGTAPSALAEHLLRRHGGVDVVVHNAGITRDRSFVNLDEGGWTSVLDVNLRAPLRLTDGLLAREGALRRGARVVQLSSINGIAGAKGQANYAASKAGVIGMVRALDTRLAANGGAANAVAPGFVETAMTARMPLLPRELGRRVNSLQQGGLPVDVAEAVAFLADPAAAGVSGQVLRVCGQNLLGA
ncbi:3-oxoacyl-ACP reductase [Kineococcus sp. R8]|uniref:3-oxoacyl-ACP reductase n=1 Tax=Kineococcus siccus TaxID=2696567 RepID=UPI0014124E67|nr:3-oxoacyl-ACP reductase [Kineococcus siccus]